MQVILLDKMRHLGNLGQEVKVKPGYGRNYLIPQGKAVLATKQNIAKFELRRAELEKAAAVALEAAKARVAALADMVIEICAKAGDEGKLFGSVGTKDMIDALAAKNVHVEKSEILMPNGAIRNTGEYEIGLQFHTDVRVTIKVNVVAE